MEDVVKENGTGEVSISWSHNVAKLNKLTVFLHKLKKLVLIQKL